MKHYFLISLILVAGCDRIQSTTDRLLGRSDSKTVSTTTAEAPADGATAASEVDTLSQETTAEPDPQLAEPGLEPGWVGARPTIAGLGDPGKGGRWLETPLVSQERNGRVVVRKTGASANITLIPIPGDPGAGSRLSLEAMRALLAPIDELVELDVYSN